MDYNKLVEISQNEEIKYEIHSMGYSLKMANHYNPVSVTPSEFDCIRNFILEHKLKRGYEVATAFGISALAAGLAFKETGGKLVTMDAYIEEQYGQDVGYKEKQGTYLDADGFKSMQALIKHFELGEVIHPRVGWSPNDTESVISSVFDLNEEKLDYVFIDAGHWDSALLADVRSIAHLLDDKFIVFMHDWHAFSDACKAEISSILKVPVQAANSGGMPQGFNLVYATNIT
jgi:predicted O-methyltransferase YrrM